VAIFNCLLPPSIIGFCNAEGEGKSLGTAKEEKAEQFPFDAQEAATRYAGLSNTNTWTLLCRSRLPFRRGRHGLSSDRVIRVS
jgi:hypothetical protein